MGATGDNRGILTGFSAVIAGGEKRQTKVDLWQQISGFHPFVSGILFGALFLYF